VVTAVRSHAISAAHERGFTYLALLLAIAILGIGLSMASEVWVTTARRQKVEQVEWIGDQFSQALCSYYAASPGSVKVFPTTPEELLEDRRYLTIRRHLRSLYANPFTGKLDWQWMVGADGRLRGVRMHIPNDAGSRPREFVCVPNGG